MLVPSVFVHSSLALVLSFRTLRNLTRSLSSMELAKDVAFSPKHLAEQPARRSPRPTNLQGWSTGESQLSMMGCLSLHHSHPIDGSLWVFWMPSFSTKLHVRITMFAKDIENIWWNHEGSSLHTCKNCYQWHMNSKMDSMNSMKKVNKASTKSSWILNWYGYKRALHAVHHQTKFIHISSFRSKQLLHDWFNWWNCLSYLFLKVSLDDEKKCWQ